MRNIADVGVRRTFATYVDVEGIELVFIRISPGPNNALLSGLLWATENMQTQGPKTIGHMNTYISMLDFTSVPAWIILYCFTAGGCFSCLSCKFFLSGILHWVFSGSRHGSFGVHARGPPCGVKSAD